MAIQIDNNEILDFVEYVNEFYNPETGVFPIEGATVKAITEAIKIYISQSSTWGGGDSVDREFVRDIIKINNAIGGVVIK